MDKPQLFKGASKNKLALYFCIGIAAVMVFSLTTVFPIWNLFPKYVTEQVKVVSVDKNGCIAQTQDNNLVNIGKCTANPGDSVRATYDANVAQRSKAFLP
jgi:hypothetical protein